MARRKPRKKSGDLPPELSTKEYFGYRAQVGQQILESSTIGALPIVNHFLRRMNLQALFEAHVPAEDGRTKISTSTALLLLVRNVVMSREPLYGIGEWAEHFPASLLDLRCMDQLKHLNDDRIGRALDKLFDTEMPALVLEVMRHVVKEFGLGLEEFHNDATSISFYGAYDSAREERRHRGRQRIAITRGHSKSRRPDLKQLLYTLTISEDGGVPVHYAVNDGNAAESDTHPVTWQFLCDLVGQSDFLYVADCKLATIDNMRFIDQRGGRFITVLPATRKEEKAFRERVLKSPDSIEWEVLYETHDEQNRLIKRISRCKDSTLSAEGYKILWCHNTQKQEHDIHMRTRQIERATSRLLELRDKLHSPKTRYRDRAKVTQAVEKILKTCEVERWVTVEISERKEHRYKSHKRGRPKKDTPFTRVELSRFNFTFSIDTVRLAEDNATAGMFSLITNVADMSEEQVIRAYGRQPAVERRFKNLKTDYEVAPVFLKEVSRIQAFLGIYFFGLVAQALLEREIRKAMAPKYKAIPLYPEERLCKSPTASRIIELFEGVQVHTLRQGDDERMFFTELSPLQRTTLKLLRVPASEYGL